MTHQPSVIKFVFYPCLILFKILNSLSHIMSHMYNPYMTSYTVDIKMIRIGKRGHSVAKEARPHAIHVAFSRFSSNKPRDHQNHVTILP